jgi:membrane protein implicated in regulation of membrane protease activity
MEWWMWALLGFGLFAGEMLTPGAFYFAFFGVGAVVTSILVVAGIGGPPWMEWLLFSVISLVCLVPLRGRLVRWANATEHRPVDSMVGEEIVLLDDVGPGNPGKGEMRGTTWTVRTDGQRTFARGERVCVARVDGLTLWIAG